MFKLNIAVNLLNQLDKYLDDIVNLLFDLSSIDRLTLLLTIRKEENLRLTKLAEKISATIQETSRHLGRLIKANLIEKNSDGFYRLTSYGQLVLLLLSSISLISKTRDYFLSHDVSFLPLEFIERIGELSEYEHAQNVSSILRHIEQAMSLANEYVCLMADQVLVTGPSVAQAVSNHDLSVRIIILKSGYIPEQYQLFKTLLGNKLELKLLSDENAKIAIAMNEKIAGVCFSDLNGKMDFDSGFRSSSTDFHKWCNDVFNFYWNRSKKPFLTAA